MRKLKKLKSKNIVIKPKIKKSKKMAKTIDKTK